MISTYDVAFYGFLAALLVPVVGVVGGLLWYFRLHRAFAHLARRTGFRWWDAAGPLVLAGGVFLLASLLGDPPAEGESGRLLFAVSGAAVVLGAFGAALSLGNLDEYRQLTAGAATAGAVDEGPAVVSGTASARRDAATAPLSGEQALCYALRVTEDRGFAHRRVTAEIQYEQEGTTFAVDDGTGTVLVDPADGSLRLRGGDQLSPDAAVSGDHEGEQSAAVERIRDRLGLRERDGRRYEETRLPPDAPVTVLGTVCRDPELAHPVLRNGDRRLVVFQGALDEVRDRLRSRVRFGAALGVVGLVGGAAGVLLVAGAI